jgi:phosphoketolase
VPYRGGGALGAEEQEHNRSNYLQDNQLLGEPLRVERFKPAAGPLRTIAGLSFISAHLKRLIEDTDANVIYLTGPGHGGPAIVAKYICKEPTRRFIRTSRKT